MNVNILRLSFSQRSEEKLLEEYWTKICGIRTTEREREKKSEARNYT